MGEENIVDLLNLRICDRIGTGRPKEQPFRFRKYKAMVEQALRDPISVSALKVDGTYLMETLHMKPGRRMGWILHALLEEVLEDPTLNTVETLTERVKDLDELDDKDLQVLGEKGKEKKEEVNEEEIGKLHVKQGVKKK